MQNFQTKLEQIYKNFKAGNYYFPPYIQRRVVWSIKKNAIPYLDSLLRGNAVNPIVIVEIQDSIDHAMNETKNPNDVRYFQGLLRKGYRYIVLDGQNRLVNMCNFIDNVYTISGNFKDIHADEHSIINKTYSELDQKLQLSFKQATVGMVKMENKSKEELHGVFKAINSGQPLNRMETRNSFPTDIATSIREAAETTEMSEMFKRIYTEKSLRRMDDIQLYLSAHLAIAPKSLTISKTAARNAMIQDNLLDEFYNLGVGKTSTDVKQYSQSYLRRTENILSSVARCIAASEESRVPLKQFWALVYIFEHAYENNLHVVSNELLYSFVRSVDKELFNASKELQVKEAKQAKKEGKAEKGDSTYYWHASSTHKYPTSRDSRKKKLIPAIFESNKPQKIFRTHEEFRAWINEEESEEIA